MYELEKGQEGTYLLPKTGDMRVPGLIVATEELLHEIDIKRPLEQVRNVAFLPGIVGYSIAMPDIHWGYGFPIGGVAAMDSEKGVISPGGVGYDINCGVRLAILPEEFRLLTESQKKKIIQKIYSLVPSGVGKEKPHISGLSERDYRSICEKGARWSVEQGYGLPSDLEFIESHGVIHGADCNAVSHEAKERGKKQLGSIGSGNHFVEIGIVEKIFRSEIASAWGVTKGQIYILIHSGSRGFGHQICQDTLNTFIKKGYAEGFPDKQLVAAPIKSDDGKRYFAAMAAAANYAFNNRQQILHQVRQAFRDALGTPPEKIRLIYDVCHNIAKFEEHEYQGKNVKLCVHRKGATRAFGPGAKELNAIYRLTGQPVLVPGDMGRASHLMAGTGNPLTWCSSCHGAGRARSRHQSLNAWKGREPIEQMAKQGVRVMANSSRTVAEEMPDAYKDVDAVVTAVERANLAKMVARLKPHLVVKG